MTTIMNEGLVAAGMVHEFQRLRDKRKGGKLTLGEAREMMLIKEVSRSQDGWSDGQFQAHLRGTLRAPSGLQSIEVERIGLRHLEAKVGRPVAAGTRVALALASSEGRSMRFDGRIVGPVSAAGYTIELLPARQPAGAKHRHAH